VPRPLEGELTFLFARSYARTWPIGLALTLAVFVAATLWFPIEALAPSFIIVVGAIVATGATCRHYAASRPVVVVRRWRTGFVFGELLHSSGWALFAAPFFISPGDPLDINAQRFLLVTALIVMVTTALLRTPIFAAVIASLVPWSIIALMGAVDTPSVESWTLVLLLAVAQGIFAFFAWRLHRATAAMIRSRAEIEASFAELERARATSSEAHRRANEADRAKQLFLATMSHELRTPLNAILGFSEVMKNEVLGSHSTPSYREYSSDIHGSGQHLLSLINEILDLTRIHAGQYELKEEPLRLGDLIVEVLGLMAPSIQAKGLRFATEVDQALVPIRADGRAVRQIVGNLVSNAIKFNGSGSRITIKAGWTSRGGQYLSVVDEGPGIPADEIPTVLSSFGRGSLAVSTAAQGVGLGLPIVKGLVELHGGRFHLRSEPGRGTEATVIFPAERTEGDERPGEPTESSMTVAA
jgi:two-component system cell cycle sensor histidine kinase PleC